MSIFSIAGELVLQIGPQSPKRTTAINQNAAGEISHAAGRRHGQSVAFQRDGQTNAPELPQSIAIQTQRQGPFIDLHQLPFVNLRLNSVYLLMYFD